MTTETPKLYRRALLLSYFTVGYNIIEFALSIIAGILAGSIALIGFGLDSFVESLSAGIMIWRFRKHGKVSEREEERIEKRAERFVGYTFLVLATYILYESIDKLINSEIPEPSLFGIVIALISLIVMPFLFYKKYQTGRAINSRSLIADSKETLTCSFLSLTLLIGLGANYLSGVWQADPIAGLVIVVFLGREGFKPLRVKQTSQY